MLPQKSIVLWTNLRHYFSVFISNNQTLWTSFIKQARSNFKNSFDSFWSGPCVFICLCVYVCESVYVYCVYVYIVCMCLSVCMCIYVHISLFAYAFPCHVYGCICLCPISYICLCVCTWLLLGSDQFIFKYISRTGNVFISVKSTIFHKI